ncbi:TPA: hypothetical protein QH041_003097 [Legionella pneumophila]|nr:hypothetical protein [Legionella pneumophila]HDS3863206.1 hypothetical protein [Legionella pneumophila]
MKKRILVTTALATMLWSMTIHAKIDSVVYRCPTINEIHPTGTRTSIHQKTVHWKITDDSHVIQGDNPEEFMQVILKIKDSDSYDRTVSCVYRTKGNKKYTLNPISSFSWYVDGVAEKTAGTHWNVASNGNLECSHSVKNCMFQFR